MTETNDLLDVIHVGSRTYKGIVDYATTKHYVFYDLTNNDDPNISMIVIIWRSYFNHMRFSVFKSIHFPHAEVGNSFLLRKKEVTSEQKLPNMSRTKRSVTRITRR